MTKALPIVMIALSLGAATVYATAHDWRHVVYWIAGAVLTAAVTF